MTQPGCIDIHQAKALIDQEDVTVVDMRDAAAFEDSHIKNAIPLNDDNVEEFVRTTDKSKPLICYCYHGISSQSAVVYFSQQGFSTVYSMAEGFEGWRSVYPVVSS